MNVPSSVLWPTCFRWVLLLDLLGMKSDESKRKRERERIKSKSFMMKLGQCPCTIVQDLWPKFVKNEK